MLHERSSITAFFAEHPKLQHLNTFIHTLWVHSGKSKKKTNKQNSVRTLYILKILYRVLYERSNITTPFAERLKFQKKHDFYAFTFSQTWQNKINKISIRALYIFILLYTRCSTKGAVILLLSWSTLYVTFSKGIISWF